MCQKWQEKGFLTHKQALLIMQGICLFNYSKYAVLKYGEINLMMLKVMFGH